jgi:uncharacterized protein YrrD
MLWNATAITGYAIAASDGQIGTASDLLFDPASWAIHWLVVDTGHWLPGRKVLLPAAALGQPDPALRQIPVRRTLAQVEAGPVTDLGQPIALAIDALLAAHAAATPASHPAPPPDPALALQSIAALIGHRIAATDSDIGHVEDLLVDPDGWVIRYIKVATGTWLSSTNTLISPLSVRHVDQVNIVLELDVTAQKVRDAPPYDLTETVDGAYDERFLTYYGIRWTEK